MVCCNFKTSYNRPINNKRRGNSMMSEQLIELRKKKGISQEELAHEIGVSRQAVSKWETGQGFPDTDKLIKLVEFYDTSADYILFGRDPVQEEESIWKDKNFVKAMVFFGMITTIIALSIIILFFR